MSLELKNEKWVSEQKYLAMKSERLMHVDEFVQCHPKLAYPQSN